MPHPQPQEHLPGDIRPQAAKAHIQHIDGAAHEVPLLPRRHGRQLNDLLYRHGGAHLPEGDGPRGEPRAGEGIDIPPMEGVALPRTGQAVDALIDHPRFADALHALDVGERAVIGGDDILPARGAHRDAAPGRPHAGVDHRDEHCTLRPILHRLDQPVARLPDVIGGDVMR